MRKTCSTLERWERATSLISSLIRVLSSEFSLSRGRKKKNENRLSVSLHPKEAQTDL